MQILSGGRDNHNVLVSVGDIDVDNLTSLYSSCKTLKCTKRDKCEFDSVLRDKEFLSKSWPSG